MWFPTTGWVHCPDALQKSVVQGLPSSAQGALVRAGCVHAPLASQTSLVHALPSSGQPAPAWMLCAQVPAALHTSVVQGLLSVVQAVPVSARCWHTPAALHTSLVQALSSLVQGSPSVTVLRQPLAPQVSTVHGLLSLHWDGMHGAALELLPAEDGDALEDVVPWALLLADTDVAALVLAARDDEDTPPALLAVELPERALLPPAADVPLPRLLLLVVLLLLLPATAPASPPPVPQNPSWHACPSGHWLELLHVATHAPLCCAKPSGQSDVLLHPQPQSRSTSHVFPNQPARGSTTSRSILRATGEVQPAAVLT